jgi:hypothetical protein
MATNVDKGLYAAPQGIEALAAAGQTEPLVVEILDENGDVIETQGEAPANERSFGENLVDVLDASVVATATADLDTLIDEDKRSRADWEDSYKKGLELMGLKYEERTTPWAGACGVSHPMITEAVVRFQSETIMETFPAGGPVQTKLLGEETKEKKAAAARVRADMNYQLTERMIEFRSEHEKMLWNLSPVGCAFKKVYDDPGLGRQVSMFVPAEDVVIPYGAANVYSAERVTHVMRKTKLALEREQRSGLYSADVTFGTPDKQIDEIKDAKNEQTGFTDIEDDSFTVYEIQALMHIPGAEDDDEEGVPHEYVITKLRGGEILSIYRNWREDDQHQLRRQHFVQYDYVPGFGPYGYGLFHLIGGYAKAATSITRQLVDAGTLSNLPGGLKTRGLRIKGDATPISPGEWRDVDVVGGQLRDNLMPLPYKEPSAVLAGLLEKIIEEGRRLPGMADMKISDMSAQTPVGTTLALLERQLKVMSAVQARVHNSLKMELKLLKAIIADSADDEYDYQTDAQVPRAKQADYAMVEVIPVSDPSAATLSQRVVQYQAVMQLAQQSPQVYDVPLLHRSMLEVMGIKNADKLVPMKDEVPPLDPISENMRVLTGKPVKAFLHQNHQAHIAAHQAAMQDPMIMQMLGQNPQAQGIMAAAQAHLAEHAAFMYRQLVEQQMGMPLPAPDQPISPQEDAQLSQTIAQAAQQVLQQNQAQAKQQQAQQIQQDPMYQLQVRALDQKDREITIKENELKAKAADMADKTELAEKKLAIDATYKVDQIEVAERKLVQSGELGEQANEVRALHVGMMGRAQDQQILIKDREMAQRERDRLDAENKTNQTGESGAGRESEETDE